MFYQIKEGLRQFFFPDNCLNCRAFLNSSPRQQLCLTCLDKIQLNTPPFYAIDIPDLDKAWPAYIYDEPLRSLLHQFKYKGKTALHKTFVQLIINFIDRYQLPLANIDVIAPIPLHPTRLRERGYNQSLLLAQGVADYYKIPLIGDLLLKPNPTQTQAHLDRKQRFTNLHGAFKMNSSYPINDKSVLIVDDLLTTGATASAAAHTLKEAGAAYVGILTLAVT